MPRNLPKSPSSIGWVRRKLSVNDGYPYPSAFQVRQTFQILKEKFVVLALSILLVVTSVLMVLLVLLHKGKGSGLSDLFGGGISSSYGGSSVVERNLDRITIVVGGLWFAGVIALSLVLKKQFSNKIDQRR